MHQLACAVFLSKFSNLQFSSACCVAQTTTCNCIALLLDLHKNAFTHWMSAEQVAAALLLAYMCCSAPAALGIWSMRQHNLPQVLLCTYSSNTASFVTILPIGQRYALAH
jgi:hypothetical protein